MITWIGPITTQTGFAEEGRALVTALEEATAAAVKTIDIPVPERADQIALLPRPHVPAPGADDVHIYHRYWPSSPEHAQAVNIWRAMFETTRAPIGFVERSAEYEYIWVPCEFNATTFAESGIPPEKIRVVHQPNPTWSPELLASIGRHRHNSKDRPFRFVSVMRWQRRKGWDVLLDSFLEVAKDAASPVELVIRARLFDERDTQQINRDVSAYFGSGGPPENLTIITRELGRAEMVDLYADADCFVLPSRGEGWGRPYVEAILAGTPVIAPAWSGCTDYITTENAYTFTGTLQNVGDQAVEEWALYDGHQWLEPDRDSVIGAMRRAIADGRPSCERRRAMASDLSAKFSPTAVGAQMRTLLLEDNLIASRWTSG